jgi:hypothetical protein
LGGGRAEFWDREDVGGPGTVAAKAVLGWRAKVTWRHTHRDAHTFRRGRAHCGLQPSSIGTWLAWAWPDLRPRFPSRPEQIPLAIRGFGEHPRQRHRNNRRALPGRGRTLLNEAAGRRPRPRVGRLGGRTKKEAPVRDTEAETRSCNVQITRKGDKVNPRLHQNRRASRHPRLTPGSFVGFREGHGAPPSL